MMNTHRPFLEQCFRLAEIAADNGESRVGAVIVKDGTVIGEGAEQSRSRNDVTRHAEVVAILDAIERHGPDACNGATLYSNVEPCILCAYAIRHYQLNRIVYVKRAGEIGAVHGQYPILSTDTIHPWGTPPEIIEIEDTD